MIIIGHTLPHYDKMLNFRGQLIEMKCHCGDKTLFTLSAIKQKRIAYV